jgi:hypothetical protein
MYKETADDGLSLMTIRSFGPHSNPNEGSLFTFISREDDP